MLNYHQKTSIRRAFLLGVTYAFHVNQHATMQVIRLWDSVRIVRKLGY